MKKIPLGTYLSTILLISSVQAACADDAEVRQAEQQVSDAERRMGANSDSVTYLWSYLAGVYQQNGYRQKAKQTFEKYLSYLKTKPDADTAVPEELIRWASTISGQRRVFSFPRGQGTPEEVEAAMKREAIDHQDDEAQALRLMDQALQMLNRLPDDNATKLNNYWRVSQQYRLRGRFGEADRYDARLESFLRNSEKTATTNEQVCVIANGWKFLADGRTTYGGNGSGDGTLRSEERNPAEGLTLNSWNRPLSTRDFDLAEQSMLQFLRLADKLAKTNNFRISAHREMVGWYRRFGKTSAAENQTKELASLLGTSDPQKLFPPHPYCPGCGRG